MYTIEDIELIRKKSGISYQEAVALLDYHNGDVARALVDLEKNGKLKENKDNNHHERNGETIMEARVNVNGKEINKGKALNWLQKMYRFRLHVNKGKTTVLNLSILFSLCCLIFAPHLTIAGLILSLILGYQFSFTKDDENFASESLEKMVRSAAQNAKSSVESVVQNFNQNVKKESPEARKENEPAVQKTAPVQENTNEAVVEDLQNHMDSFFEHNPASGTYHSAYTASAASVPTIQIPVQVESSEGSMTIESDQDGYHSATIG